MRPLLILLVVGVEATGQEALRKDIDVVAAQGLGTAAGREAWQRLADAGPEAARLLLEAMDTPSVVKANWFYTALDRVVLRARQDKTAGLDLDHLLSFAKDTRRQGRARRVALEIVEEARPGSLAKLLPGWTDDPEFRPEALDLVMEEAARLVKEGKNAAAIDKYRLAFEQ